MLECIEEGGDDVKIEIGPTYAQGVFEGTDYMYVTKDGSESGVVGDVFYESFDVVPKEHILYIEYLKVVYDGYYEKKRKYDAMDELEYQKRADAEQTRKDETDGT